MLHMGRTYSDLPDTSPPIEISRLVISAWWKEGKRKVRMIRIDIPTFVLNAYMWQASNPINAKKRPVILACLGQAVTLTLTRLSCVTQPKSSLKRISGESGSGRAQTTPNLDVDENEGNTLASNSNLAAENLKAHDVVISMVHGDVLVVSGDTYEVSWSSMHIAASHLTVLSQYALKRHGTGIRERSPSVRSPSLMVYIVLVGA